MHGLDDAFEVRTAIVLNHLDPVIVHSQERIHAVTAGPAKQGRDRGGPAVAQRAAQSEKAVADGDVRPERPTAYAVRVGCPRVVVEVVGVGSDDDRDALQLLRQRWRRPRRGRRPDLKRIELRAGEHALTGVPAQLVQQAGLRHRVSGDRQAPQFVNLPGRVGHPVRDRASGVAKAGGAQLKDLDRALLVEVLRIKHTEDVHGGRAVRAGQLDPGEEATTIAGRLNGLPPPADVVVVGDRAKSHPACAQRPDDPLRWRRAVRGSIGVQVEVAGVPHGRTSVASPGAAKDTKAQEIRHPCAVRIRHVHAPGPLS